MAPACEVWAPCCPSIKLAKVFSVKVAAKDGYAWCPGCQPLSLRIIAAACAPEAQVEMWSSGEFTMNNEH